MKKRFRKIISMLLAAAMVLSMGLTGLAAEIEPMSSSSDEEFTIIVNPAYSGETYTAYKIFDVTYNGDENNSTSSYSYTIDKDSAWYDTVSNSGLFTLTQISGSNTYVVTAKDSTTSEAIAAAFTKVPEGASVAATATPKFDDNSDGSTGSGSVTLDVTTSGAGYYFVTTSMGSLVSLDTTNPSATIEDKNVVPTLTKELENVSHNGELEDNNDVTEGSKDTAKVGDIIEFEIKISDAAHKSALTLHDYTQEGLTYYGSEHINIYLNNVSASNLVASANYTINDSNCEDGCDFEITFNAEWLDDISDDDVIIVTYEAVVNEAAGAVNLNDAYITYGVAGKSVVVETETDVYSLSLKKVDGDGNELEGATFTLAYGNSFGTSLNGTLVSFDYDAATGTYIIWDPYESHSDGIIATSNILVGSATIFGLDAGTYTLTETAAPDGYNKLTSTITVTIANDGTVSISGDTQGSLTNGTITIVNNAGSILPGTGGMGTTIFYIVGIVLMIGAAAFFVARKRISKEE